MNPFITDHPDIIYTRLLAITWHANILAPSTFTLAGGDKLHQCILADTSSKPVILNCVGISAIEDYALDAIRSYLATKSRCITFLVEGTNEDVIRKIEKELNDIPIQRENRQKYQLLICGKPELVHSGEIELDNLANIIGRIEYEYVARQVNKSYEPYNPPQKKRLHSTPLIADGEFNARSIISNPKAFIWISLLLTDKFLEAVEQDRPKSNRLLAVSLRGSPFAAAIRVLAANYCPTLEIIDHIGPRHELLEGHISRDNMCGEEYILVSDFVIGGTEIKVAKTYAIALGARLKSAIAIGAYLPGDKAYDTNVKLRSVVRLGDAKKDITYEFNDREFLS